MTTYSEHRMFHRTSREREREKERETEIDREGENEQFETKWDIGDCRRKEERMRGRGRRSKRGERKSTG